MSWETELNCSEAQNQNYEPACFCSLFSFPFINLLVLVQQGAQETKGGVVFLQKPGLYKMMGWNGTHHAHHGKNTGNYFNAPLMKKKPFSAQLNYRYTNPNKNVRVVKQPNILSSFLIWHFQFFF